MVVGMVSCSWQWHCQLMILSKSKILSKGIETGQHGKLANHYSLQMLQAISICCDWHRPACAMQRGRGAQAPSASHLPLVAPVTSTTFEAILYVLFGGKLQDDGIY